MYDTDVVACPRCGLVLCSPCWHDGIEVAFVVMKCEDALELRRLWIYALLAEAVQYATDDPTIADALHHAMELVNS